MIDSGLLQIKDMKDIDGENPSHRAIVVGVSTLGAPTGSVTEFLVGHKRLEVFIRDIEGKCGRDCFVRIRQNIFFNALDDAREPGCGMSWRNFSVLCAVYSILGTKPYMRICRDRIQAAALGYKSPKRMPSSAIALTDNQLRTTLDNLEKKGFFCRAHPSPRKTYFSNRMTAETLKKRVLEFIQTKPDRLTLRRILDLQLQQGVRDIKEHRAFLCTTPP